MALAEFPALLGISRNLVRHTNNTSLYWDTCNRTSSELMLSNDNDGLVSRISLRFNTKKSFSASTRPSAALPASLNCCYANRVQ